MRQRTVSVTNAILAQPSGSSDFKAGAAKSHQNLVKRAFSKLDACDLACTGFETGALELPNNLLLKVGFDTILHAI